MKKKTTTKKRIKGVRGSYSLPIQTVTLVPSTTTYSKKISPTTMTKRVKETRLFLSKMFGGYTSSRATGGYIMKKKNKQNILIKEQVVKVTSFAKRPAFLKNKQKWINWCKRKKKEWKQDSIGIIIENDMYYV